MAQIKNETGDIKCINEKGNVAWFSPYLVNEGMALRMNGYSVVDGIEPLLPVINSENIDDFTREQLKELLQGKAEFKQTDNKETLFNLYINLNK